MVCSWVLSMDLGEPRGDLDLSLPPISAVRFGCGFLSILQEPIQPLQVIRVDVIDAHFEGE
jgi:hypothetical protein